MGQGGSGDGGGGKGRSLADGFVAAIEQCGADQAEQFPPGPLKNDELPDRLVELLRRSHAMPGMAHGSMPGMAMPPQPQ
jgi:hypothetical protein